MAEDLAAFAARLLRFDPGALIRLRGGWAWGWLPWEVLVRVPCDQTGDRVITAVSGESRDAQWRHSLPPPGRVVETVPAAAVAKAATAAAQTLRELGPAARDPLLDHSVITGTSDADGTPFAVPQRLVQAIVRMGLLEGDTVDVLVAGPWTGLGTRLGEAWHRKPSGLAVRPLR